MTTIDTWEGLGAALAADLPRPLKQILTATRDRLAEFADQPLNTLCTILILDAGDPFDPEGAEYIAETDGWYELVLVTGDDGQGLVVLVEDLPEGNRELLDHCRANAAD